jgi:tRNA-splicing ligase RtcB
MQIVQLLQNIAGNPENYKNHRKICWRELAELLSPTADNAPFHELLEQPLPYAVFGRGGIEPLALRQMDTAMRLPVTLGGALMPDAHAGYGLPVGGVLATRNVVLPYAVGLDIGCRMSLTILDGPASLIERYREQMARTLWDNTAFGMDETLPFRIHHPIFDKDEFSTIPILKKLRAKAFRQLGTSGGGNHFVDICAVQLPATSALNLPEGDFVGILSHSGSRGLGAAIAEHFTAIAKEQCRLPREAGPFAWLELASDAGEQYWRCMEIAGEYAAACHEVIHRCVAQGLRLKPLYNVSHHHNFAWQETLSDGTVAVVHRKGATPAHEGAMGIITGSMCEAGYLVKGRGCEAALASANHGAGRALSRQDARNSISRHTLRKQLDAAGVTLLGGTTEEAPAAYKPMREVMASATPLVEIVGTITPRIVRMNKE